MEEKKRKQYIKLEYEAMTIDNRDVIVTSGCTEYFSKSANTSCQEEHAIPDKV